MRLTLLLYHVESEINHGTYNIYNKTAITASCHQCAGIGLRILSLGGSVADAAIATLLCVGAKHPARLGIGGGFVATIYSKKLRNVEVLLARETAPKGAHPAMFTDQKEALFGGKAAAVPGCLKGYWELHKKYGKLPWSKLFEPVLQLCEAGIKVQPFTYYGLQQVDKQIFRTKKLKDILVDPFSAMSHPKIRLIHREDLVKTLELVSEKSPDILYNGELTKQFVKDVKNAGGIMEEQDLNNYSTKWLAPLTENLNKLKLKVFTTPPPCSGAILLFVLKLLNEYVDYKNEPDIEQWFKYIETLKFAYAFRTKLGDPTHNSHVLQTLQEMFHNNTLTKISKQLVSPTRNDHKVYKGELLHKQEFGTFHCNILSSNGDAICITESINTLFGALFKSHGIILNNTMSDFFTNTKHTANSIEPKKTPLSSMVPTIVTNEDASEVKLLIGSAGGVRIVSSVCQVLVRHLLAGDDIQTAIDRPRVHHQLTPMHLEFETEFDSLIIGSLSLRGHKLLRMKRQSVVSAIRRKTDGRIEAKGDVRRYCANDGS